MKSESIKSNIKGMNNEQRKKTDLFSFLKSIYPSEQLMFKEYYWEKEKDKLFKEDKIQFNHKEKNLLKSLLLKEIPPELRKSLWLISSGAKRDIINNPNYYLNLTKNYPDYIPCPYEDQINLDIPRTFPEDPFFQIEKNLQSLKNILLAYSRRNSSIGYCQGFNYIEETFWIFTEVIENYLPINFFTELAGLVIDSKIIMEIIDVNFKPILSHLKSLNGNIFINNLINKWLISLYMDGIAENFQLIIWDLFLLEGNIILFKAAFALMKMLSKDLFLVKKFEQIQNVIYNVLPNYINTGKLLYYLCIKQYNFNHKYIKKRRIYLESKTYDNINKLGVFIPIDNINQDNKDCDLDWPICVNDQKYKNEIINYITFRTLFPPNIKEEYFFKYKNIESKNEKEKKNEENKDNEVLFSELLIQRRCHTCDSKIHTITDFINEKKRNNNLINESVRDIMSQRELLYSTLKMNIDYQIKKEKNDNNIIKIIDNLPSNNYNIKISSDKIDNILDNEDN